MSSANCRRARQAIAGQAVQPRIKADVLVHRQQLVQREPLRHVADAPLHALGIAADVDAINRGAAGGRSQQAAEHADRGGLAGAIAAKKSEHLAATDVERHPIDGLESAERARQRPAPESQARRSPARPRRSLAPQRAQQARFADPQGGLQPRVFDF